MEVLFGVGVLGKDTCWSKLIQGEGCGGSESLQGAGEIQVEPEEGVMGERPEGGVCWGFRVTPEESIPQRAGAGEQGIFQHSDGRAELPPQSSAQCRLHRVFSHKLPPLFFFSHILPPKRQKDLLIARLSLKIESRCRSGAVTS